MANEEYTLQAARDEQERLMIANETQNIERLRRIVDYAKAELKEAQIQRQNRIMGYTQ